MEQHSNEPLFDLQLDHEAGNHFRESSKWAKFLSIVYFVGLGIIAFVLIFAAAAVTDAFQRLAPEFTGAGGILIALMVVGLGIVFFTTILLFRFATLTKEGIERQDQVIFNKGLQALKNYFMIYGVLTILGLLFSVFSTMINLSR